MSNYIEYNDNIIFHPGYYIQELMDESGLSRSDFADKIGIELRELNLMVDGKRSMSDSAIVGLSRMYGMSEAYWMNLQNSYDKKLAKMINDSKLERKKKLAKPNCITRILTAKLSIPFAGHLNHL